MQVEGFFSSFKTGSEAVAKLKAAGFSQAVLDINDHYIDDRNVRTNLPGTETSPTLSGLILESDMAVVDRSKGPLAAASPMVSGMAGFEEIADYNCRVMVETEEGNGDRVRQLLKEAGASLNNPNVKIPKGLENIDL